MATDIQTWEIVSGELKPVESTLQDAGKTEAYDLEEWIATDPSVVRPGLKVIGRQVTTRSGPLDLLAIDRTGRLIVIELKRDKLPREVLAQAVDYASDVASWNVDRVGEICAKYTGESLEDVLSEAFPDMDLESVSINGEQRIILVGFALDAALERMVEWLSETYGVGINAVILKYVRTTTGSEILTRTAVISEEVEEERTKQKKFTIPMSDDPGEYDEPELKDLLVHYLSRNLTTARRIRDVVLPVCLEKGTVTRDQLKEEFIKYGAVSDPSKVGYVLSLVSSQMGMEKNDFLRQVVAYDYPNNPWEKDNYRIRDGYEDVVREVLREVGQIE